MTVLIASTLGGDTDGYRPIIIAGNEVWRAKTIVATEEVAIALSTEAADNINEGIKSLLRGAGFEKMVA